MKKLKLFLCLLLTLSYLGLPVLALAQEVATEATKEAVAIVAEEENSLKAVIQAKENVAVNKTVIFDASLSYIPEEIQGEKITYKWNLGDGTERVGEEIVYSYNEPGRYQVTLELITPKEIVKAETSIFIFREMFLLISDYPGAQEKIDSLSTYAEEQGVFFKLILNFDNISEFISESELVNRLAESVEDIRQVNRIIAWTKSSSGLTILSQIPQKVTSSIDFSQKEVIFITNSNLNTGLSNIAYGTLNILGLKKIILTRSEALWPLVDSANNKEFEELLLKRKISQKLITKETAPSKTFNFLSYFVNYMIEKGIPTNSIMLILLLPIIVTIIAFTKQVIGMTTLGVYTPALLALSFLALGLQFGLLVLAIILLAGTGTRFVLRKYRLLYIPRMSLVMIVISFMFLLLLLLGGYFNITQLITISVFPMLVMTTMVEKFIGLTGDKGTKAAIIMVSETLLVAILSYLVADLNIIKSLMLGHPEIIVLLFIINIFLGRWTGLRVFEYIRFRELLRHVEEEE